MHTVMASDTTSWIVLADRVKIQTHEKIGLYNITEQVGQFVARSGILHGILIVSTLHTTTSIFINEYQDALLRDIRAVLENLVREDTFYYHNSDDYSDCERKNATAHLRSMLLGHQVVIPVQDGQPNIGTWQSIIMAELDGPRTRSLNFQIMGTPHS